MYIWDQIGNSIVTILVTLAFYGCYRLCIRAYLIYANHRRWCKMIGIAKIMTVYCGTVFSVLGINGIIDMYNRYSYRFSDIMKNVDKIINKLNNFEINCMTPKNKTVTDNPLQDLDLIKNITAILNPIIKEQVQVPVQVPVQVQVQPVQVNPIISSPDIKNKEKNE